MALKINLPGIAVPHLTAPFFSTPRARGYNLMQKMIKKGITGANEIERLLFRYSNITGDKASYTRWKFLKDRRKLLGDIEKINRLTGYKKNDLVKIDDHKIYEMTGKQRYRYSVRLVTRDRETGRMTGIDYISVLSDFRISEREAVALAMTAFNEYLTSDVASGGRRTEAGMYRTVDKKW